VRDYNNSCIQDFSDAVFTIAPPTPIITVTNPNSAVTRYIGQTNNITWTSAYLSSSFVTIEYTYDDGTTWNMISNITNNTGSFAWQIPNTPSAQCRVRISEYGNPAVFDESNVNFTIAHPWITVTSPNGGETWKGCTPGTITWSSAGTSGSFRIYYSLNNGASWTSITTSSSSSYSWSNVIDMPSTQALIKVADNNNLTLADSSDAVFTILKNNDIVIISPNGSESWEVGTTQNISWVSEPTTNRYVVHYSTNNGAAWSQITSSTYSTSQSWPIPNEPSNQALIRVRDYNNSCIQDFSDAVFTIAPPTPIITVTNPNSAVTRYIGQTNNITWTSAYLSSSFVTIEYTYDDGTTWNMISNITNNTGSFAWQIPNTPSAQCRVRISEYGNPAVFDESNVNFTIAHPWITVTSPNGGETWKGCTPGTITWSSAGTSGSFRIYYSLNNGASWTSITTSSSSSYSWSNVIDMPSTQALIKVADNNNLTLADSSDAVFTILKNNDIVIISPNGSESWEVGTTQNISWVSEPTTNRYVVHYSTNNGAAWSQITSSTYSTSQSWPIPNEPSNQALIRVRDYNNSCIQDFSDAVFTIAPPTPIITVTNPNSAVTRYIGQTNNITWTSAYLSSSFVTIEYTYDDGTTWNMISNITNNTGSFAWQIPNTPSAQCRVRISEYGNPAVFDESNVNFTIAHPWITVTSPNGGEVITKCYSQTVTWISAGTSGTFRIYYSVNNGNTWTSIGTTSSSSSGWNTANVPVSDHVLIKVADNNNLSISDSSDTVFSVIENLDIIINSPNGGEQWQAGTQKTLSWVSVPTTDRYVVSYSTDSGNNWNTITSSTYSTTHNWTVPNAPTNQALIRVRDYNNSCIQDESDAPFSITPGIPALTVPNGGQTWFYASTYNITWTSEYFYSTFVTISYSLDSGATWLPIIAATNNTGSYSWQVPATYSTKCLVRVNAYNNPSVYDVSDAVFTIAPALTILTPNGNNALDEWRVCTQTTIQWTSGGTSSSFKIEYSVNGGQTWSNIISSFSSSGTNHTYNWTIPNTPSTQCLVRVTDNGNSLKTDVSDAVFTIKPSIIVTSPNGGESFAQGSQQTITWTADGASNYYSIDYSINDGSTWTNIAFNQYITTNSYVWTVPAVVSSNCRIRVVDHISTCKQDISDYTFAIGMPAPQILVTSPNGGEILSGCSLNNITWTSSNTSGNYTIEFSEDSGMTWQTIVSNLNNPSGIYSWTVPNISSSQCLIRIKDFNNPSVADESNSTFTINTSLLASITANGPTTFCDGGSVILTSGSPTGNVWYPGGQTSQSITVSASGSYHVVVTDNNCIATSNVIHVHSNPIPPAPVASNNSPVSMYGTAELYAGTIPNATYSWSGPNGFTSAVQNPVIPNATSALSGTYSVSATVNGCTGVASTTDLQVTSTPSNVLISGNIITETGQYVEGVTVLLSGTSTDSIITNASGAYQFDVVQGQSYVITPLKNNDLNKTNGISTLDIVMMQRHILNVQPFNSPYKIIAADVDLSHYVTNMDIVLTRAFILQNITSYPGNHIWKFVNSDFMSNDPMNPFPFEQSRSYSNAFHAVDQNFIAVKLGDVNNSWNPSMTKSLYNTGLTFEMGNYTVSPTQHITIPVFVRNFNNISGVQFTAEWDESVINFVSANNVFLDMSYGNTQAQDGKLAVLWSTEDINGLTLPDNTVIFEMVFEITGQHGTYSPLSFTSSMTEAEAYDNLLDELVFNKEDGEVSVNQVTDVNTMLGPEDFQARVHPNPFSHLLNIHLSLQNEELLNFRITDVLGRTLKDESQLLTPGHHHFHWDGTDMNGQRLPGGTYFLKISSRTNNKVIKVILTR
jgi:ribonuclease PH